MRVLVVLTGPVDNFLRERRLCPKTMGEVDDAFLMLEAVARGGFVAFVPKSVARSAVEQRRVKILAHFRPTSAGVHALFHRAEGPDLARTAVTKLIEHAREHFERED